MLNVDLDIKYNLRIQKLISKSDWLKDCDVKIIEDRKVDAFAFTLFKLSWIKIKKINIIILTTSLMDIVDNDEDK